jgi:CubicO group peptidase (beta-lactamase class C family)
LRNFAKDFKLEMKKRNKPLFILFTSIFFFAVLLLLFHKQPWTASEGNLDDDSIHKFLLVDSIFLDLQKKQIDSRATTIESAFQRLCRKTGFNGVVLYAEHGNIVYKEAFGYADLAKRKTRLQIEDQFQLASVSKMFTAAAIMILKQEEKLDYDVDLRTYIPEWPYEDYTIRLLLTHRTGISRYESLAHDYWKDKKKPLFNDDMIRLYAEYQPNPYFKPNKGFHYCNANYALLATVVERVSGMYFEDFMKKRIFEPLGMHHSFIYSMRGDTVVSPYIPYGIDGYDASKRYITRVKNEYLNAILGDKMMYSTVEDLYKFNVALDYELLVPNTLLQEAFSPGSPQYNKRKDNYGFGWRIKSDQDSAAYHYGWWKGFRSFYLRDMRNERALIVLTNKDKGPGASHFWEIINDKSIMLPPSSVNINYVFKNTDPIDEQNSPTKFASQKDQNQKNKLPS